MNISERKFVPTRREMLKGMLAPKAAMAGYAGSGSDGGKEALGAVGKLIRTETIPGTPESDAVRFYTNAVGFVEINYDEDKAGVLGIFEH